MKAILLISLLAVGGIVAAQSPPAPKSAPPTQCRDPLYRASGGFSYNQLHDGCVSLSESGNFYYDYHDQKTRSDFTGKQHVPGSNVTTYRETVWLDYRQKIQYVLDHSNNECKQYPNTLPMFPPGPPPYAKIVSQSTVAGARIDAWEWSTTIAAGTNNTLLAIGEWSTNDCIPVALTMLNPTQNNAIIFSEGIFDVVPGIPDGVMGIPPNCRNGTMFNGPSPIVAHHVHAFIQRF